MQETPPITDHELLAVRAQRDEAWQALHRIAAFRHIYGQDRSPAEIASVAIVDHQTCREARDAALRGLAAVRMCLGLDESASHVIIVATIVGLMHEREAALVAVTQWRDAARKATGS